MEARFMDGNLGTIEAGLLALVFLILVEIYLFLTFP